MGSIVCERRTGGDGYCSRVPEPDLLAWHVVIAQRPTVALERFYWDAKTSRLWYMAMTIDGVSVDLLTRLGTVSVWPGFIVAADLDLDPTASPRVQVPALTPHGRKRSLCYLPSTGRWLALTAGLVGSKLLDEIEYLVRSVRAGEFRYVDYRLDQDVAKDRTLQETRRQWAAAWTVIAPRLSGGAHG